MDKQATAPATVSMLSGKGKPATIYIDDLTKFLLTQFGGGNLSLGVRLAARAVSTQDGTVAAITPDAVRAVHVAAKPRGRRPAVAAPKAEVLCAAPSPQPAAPSRIDPADNMFADLIGQPYDPDDPD